MSSNITIEEKQLLIKDLCGRLPYGIKVWYPNGSGAISTVKGIVGDVCYFNENPIYDNFCHIETVKPYLRPMSSMTEEEEDEYQECGNKDIAEAYIHLTPQNRIDYLNSHHFDYRGLIEKELAIEAPDRMYSK